MHSSSAADPSRPSPYPIFASQAHGIHVGFPHDGYLLDDCVDPASGPPDWSLVPFSLVLSGAVQEGFVPSPIPSVFYLGEVLPLSPSSVPSGKGFRSRVSRSATQIPRPTQYAASTSKGPITHGCALTTHICGLDGNLLPRCCLSSRCPRLRNTNETRLWANVLPCNFIWSFQKPGVQIVHTQFGPHLAGCTSGSCLSQVPQGTSLSEQLKL